MTNAAFNERAVVNTACGLSGVAAKSNAIFNAIVEICRYDVFSTATRKRAQRGVVRSVGATRKQRMESWKPTAPISVAIRMLARLIP